MKLERYMPTLAELQEAGIVEEGTHSVDLAKWAASVYEHEGMRYREGCGKGVNPYWSLEDLRAHSQHTSLSGGINFNPNKIPRFQALRTLWQRGAKRRQT